MSTTAGAADPGPAGRLGFRVGMVVQELGFDDDSDQSVRAGIESVIGAAMVDDDYGDVCDAVVLWWRDEDGDLVDGVVDALTDLADGGVIWLFTPKVGRDNHVGPSDISEAVETAGLVTTTTTAIGADWTATKLVSPRGARPPRR